MKMIPPIPAETLVGVQGSVGAYRVIRRLAPNRYLVSYQGREALIRREMLTHPLPVGRYLMNGESENFVTIP